jgi:phosphatidylserine decarboxylase
MSEALISDYTQFHSFNDFFTRALKPGARTIASEKNVMISPVDGCISEIGVIKKDQLLQAKGAYFSTYDLCGGDSALSHRFENGHFLTAYLSPKDYHRFHMPIKGTLQKMIYVPGQLFSVNSASVNTVPGLFARNERVICVFDTDIGTVALIAVGAMIVGSIAMRWHGIVKSPHKRMLHIWDYRDKPLHFARGEEVGHFRLGSTVIILCEHNAVTWDAALCAEKSLVLGEAIGCVAIPGE